MERGKSSKQKKKEKLCAKLGSDGRVKNFLMMADELYGLGKEATFVAVMAYAGKDVLRELIITDEKHFVKLRRPDDDLSLAFRIFQCLETEEGRKLLREICKKSDVKMAQMELLLEMGNTIGKDFCTNLNYPGPENYGSFRIESDEAVNLRKANENGILVIAALSNAFCRAFDENICTFYDIKGNGEGVFYHSKSDKQVILPDHCAAYKNRSLPQINRSQMVAFELENTKDSTDLEARFVCRLPASLLDTYPVEQLIQVRINIGPLVADKLLSKSDKFLRQQCGELTMFQSYNTSNGVLAVACSSPSAFKLRELAEGAMNNVYEKLDIQRNLQWFDEKSKALVTFSPGFEIFGLVPHPSDKEKTTIAVMFDGIQHSEKTNSLFECLDGLAKQFCENRTLILMPSPNTFYLSLPSNSVAIDFKNAFETCQFSQEVTVELKFSHMLEFFSASSAHKATEANNSYPTDNCAICLTHIDGPYVRLAICGHVYCNDCFIGLLTKSGRYPLRCLSGCQHPILFEDIALVLSRNFGDDVERIRQLLEPILHKSLEAYLQKHTDKYIRCQGEQCDCLLETNINTPEAGAGTTDGGQSLLCKGCSTDRCAVCGNAVHKGYTCQEKQSQKLAQEHPELSSWKEESPDNRRFCPNIHCKMLIEKKGGCNHMECKHCHVHFCWPCSFQAKSSGEVYAHMMDAHGKYGEEEPQLENGGEPEEESDEEEDYEDLLDNYAGHRNNQGQLLPMLDTRSQHALAVRQVYATLQSNEPVEVGRRRGRRQQPTVEVEQRNPLLQHGEDDAALFRHFMKDWQRYRQSDERCVPVLADQRRLNPEF